jgi:pyruvate dehydrogenase E2 component (dihydrolipoamide acetyltransferase)
MATVVELPRLSDTMEEGVIAKWRVAVGDKVKRGQVIAEIETDKATMEFESFDAGVVLQLVATEGETTALGAAIAVVGKPGEDAEAALAAWRGKSGGVAPAAEAPKAEAPAPKSEAPAPKAEVAPEVSPAVAAPAVAAPAVAAPALVEDGGRVPASPLARRLARENDLALTAIRGSGPHGRVIKADIVSAIEARAAAPKAASGAATVTSGAVDRRGRPFVSAPDRPVKLSQMRKTIAKRMTQSKREIPHITLTIPIVMDRVAAMRAEISQAIEGSKISFNDFVVLAVARALREHPRVNGAYSPDGIVEYGDVHVGVAVAVEDGLVVPVVRFADQKSISEISAEIRDLGARARSRTLRPEEMSGSTFTVSNLGMFGIEHFTAVVNPGEGAILAVGALSDEVVAEGGAPVIRKIMRCTLCSDHRLFDGADNARFLASLKRLLEAPMALFA